MAWGWGDESRYRMVQPLRLPKFISPKNPFASPVEKPAVESLAPPVAEKPASGMVKTQKIPAWPAQEKPAPVGSAREKQAPTWTDKLNPFSYFRGSQSPAKKSAGPIQPELSLERVKVLQNDLSDADVEIVPIKSRRMAERVRVELTAG